MSVPSGCTYRPPADPSACDVRHPVTGHRAPPQVTLFAGKKAVGAHRDDDWRIPAGEPGNKRKGGVRLVGRVTPLLDAITTEYQAEQYAVSYRITQGWVPLERGIPRMCKTKPSGFEWLAEIGHEATWDAIGIDIDNPHKPGSTVEKIPNDTGQIIAWVEQLSRPALDGWGWYVTANGVRLWRPLATAITDGDLFERVLSTARSYIDACGWESFGQAVATDASCKDMSRLMSLAYILKKGRMFYSPWVDLSRMWAADYEPTEEIETKAARRRAPKASAELYSFEFTAPPYVLTMLAHLTQDTLRDMRPGVSRHDLMRAVAGALISRHFEPELIPSAVEAISFRLGLDSTHTADDYRGARETVEAWQAGERKITGMASLKRGAPTLALAIDQLCSTARARLDAAAHVEDPLPTADQASEEMYGYAARAFAGEALVIIGGTCGVGKSRLALRLVEENLSGRWPAGATGHQAEYTRRAVLAPPTQEVAVELQTAAAAQGLSLVRWTSGLSERDPDGSYVCVHRARLVLMSEGGLSAQHHGCNGGGVPGSVCAEKARGCRAAVGCVDPDGSPVDPTEPGFADAWPTQIATHARLGHALAKLGSRAKAIVDESFATTELATLTVADLDATIEELWNSATGGGGMFAHNYARALLPAVYAVHTYLSDERQPLFTPDLGLAQALGCPVPDEVTAMAPRPDARASVQATPFPKNKVTGQPIHAGAPWVKAERLPGLREHPGQAVRFARVGRVCSLLWRAAQPEAQYTGTVVLTRGKRQLNICGPSDLTRILVERQAPRILFTADAELIAPELATHFADPPKVHPIHVRDGCDVDRRLVMHPAATKSKALDGGRILPGGKHLDLLRVMVAWSLEAPAFDRLVIVTWKHLATALRYAHAPSDYLKREWRALGQTADLDAVAEECAEILRPLRLADRAVLHYGATRGVDAYREFNSLAMLGVPYPDVGSTRSEADHLATVLGIDTSDLRDQLPIARATAELGQAAGRLRLPRRNYPARILCVSDERVTPAEWERHDYERRSGDSTLARIEGGKLGGGRRNQEAMRKDELMRLIAGLGSNEAARRIGIAKSAMSRYLTGERAVPAAVADAVRTAFPLVGGVPVTYPFKTIVRGGRGNGAVLNTHIPRGIPHARVANDLRGQAANDLHGPVANDSTSEASSE